METSKAEGKRSLKEMKREEEDEDEEEVGCGIGFGDDKKKKGKKGSSVGGSSSVYCQAENCTVDMSNSKKYHRKHKVCELHSKAPVVLVGGTQQRFCQQCSRFHGISEFDDNKRSCRQRLAGHNERRRKSSSSSDCQGEGSNSY